MQRILRPKGGTIPPHYSPPSHQPQAQLFPEATCHYKHSKGAKTQHTFRAAATDTAPLALIQQSADRYNKPSSTDIPAFTDIGIWNDKDHMDFWVTRDEFPADFHAVKPQHWKGFFKRHGLSRIPKPGSAKVLVLKPVSEKDRRNGREGLYGWVYKETQTAEIHYQDLLQLIPLLQVELP